MILLVIILLVTYGFVCSIHCSIYLRFPLLSVVVLFFFFFFLFFFNDPSTTEIYTLSLHDALPIYGGVSMTLADNGMGVAAFISGQQPASTIEFNGKFRSEEHTSELQSRSDLVCRLLLEKKKHIIQLSVG